MTLWRWEFLRRRQDYRQDWEEFAERSYQWDLAQAANPSHESYQKPVPKPDDPDFLANILYLAHERLKNPEILSVFTAALRKYEKYELDAGLPSPRIRVPTRLHFYSKYDGMIAGPQDGPFPLSLTKTQVMFNYDLSLPLDGQIKFVSMLLKKMQRHTFGKKIGRRAQPEKWPSYLRVLDAREQNVTFQRIGETLFRDDARGNFDQLAPLAKQAHEAAINLAKNFPPIDRLPFWKS